MNERRDPQCLAGSFQRPGCAAERFKAEIADLQRELSTAQAKLKEAEERRREDVKKCEWLCRKKAEDRFNEYGSVEPDTNAAYYEGSREDEYETRDEEDNDCAGAIRAAFPDVFNEKEKGK